jgi:hypothetical protein
MLETFWWFLLTIVHTLEPLYHLKKWQKGVLLLNETWAWGFDEYSKADKRYLESKTDTFQLSLQIWLFLLMPFCLITFFGHLLKKNWRIIPSTILSSFMVATTFLFYGREICDGFKYTYEYSPDKFFTHFVMANIIWLVGSFYIVYRNVFEWKRLLDSKKTN